MKYVDMAMTPEESAEVNGGGSETAPSNLPKYPYGLCVSLCEDELDKLGIDYNELQLGDFLHIHSLAKVTSLSCNERESGTSCRIELVLAFMEAESESKEDQQSDKESVTKRLYKN